jgi:glucose/arabinose dehydrogenase
MKKITLIFTLTIFLNFGKASFAQYNLQQAFPNLTFSFPVEMVHSYDGTNRIFVVTQRGRIYVFPNNPSVASAKLFLDLSDRASQSGSETGLLGLAFHPNYENNGYFYVDYTTDQPPLRTIIARYQVSPSNPDSALKSSELVLMTVNQPFSNHNGGKIAFGPDGYFYLSFGDGGSGGDPMNNAQNRSVLLGKILRINVDSSSMGNNYSIPLTNPFYGNTQGWRQEIYTWGMRNMWKFSFDLPTGRIWGADVGQGAWEEVDILWSGKNYGWRIMEGFACYNPPTGCDTTGLTMPVWAYDRNAGASVTGGYVYRGPTVTTLTGKYIYADYVSGRIWSLTYDSINPVQNTLLHDAAFFISTFGIDQNNELYLCSYSTTGRIYRFDPVPIGVGGKNGIPSSFELKQNYPNPFNPVTTIGFSLPLPSGGGAQVLRLVVYDALGREIATLVNGELSPGTHEVRWDAGNLSSGVYFYRVTAVSTSTGEVITSEKKMVLLK